MVSLDLGIHSYKLSVPEKKVWSLTLYGKIAFKKKARVANREALFKEDDQALATHTRRRRQSNFKKNSHKEYRPPTKFLKKRENSQKKYYSQYQCYNCHKIGNIPRECPLKKKKTKIRHAHRVEYEDEEEEERPWKIQEKE